MKTTVKLLAALLVCISIAAIFGGCAYETMEGTLRATATKKPQLVPTSTFTVPVQFNPETNKKVLYDGRRAGMDICGGAYRTPMETMHDSLQGNCTNIAIAKYVGMTDLYKTHYVEHHFELIEPIKGHFGVSTFMVQALQNKEYATSVYWMDSYVEVPYKPGENCIVFLDKYENVFDDPIYSYASVYIPLDENNKLKGVYVAQGKVDIGCTTIDELKAYLQQYTTLDIPGPSYATSTKLKDTVHIAQNIYRVTPYEKDKSKNSREVCFVTVVEVLKGNPADQDRTAFLWYENEMEIGKEYIISMGPAGSIVSQAHGVIPMADAKRAKEVYKILGKKYVN